MNLDDNSKRPGSGKKTPAESEAPKKLSRKEKKALKKEERKKAAEPPKPAPAAKPSKAEPKADAGSGRPAAGIPPKSPKREEVEGEVQFEPATVQTIPPPKYTWWERISPPARRKRQIANMESGFREVLGLVHAMRTNQEQLLESFKRLPDAVDSVKKLADHSAQQSELLKAMNDHMGGPGSTGKFTDTLASMDKTTQLLLERAQRSEERLYGMLKQAQRRIALMTVLVLMLFLGALAAVLFTAFPDQTRSWLNGDGWTAEPAAVITEPTPEPAPTVEPEPTAEAAESSPEPESSVEMEPVLEPDPQETGDLPAPMPDEEEAEVAADTVPENLDGIPESPDVDGEPVDVDGDDGEAADGEEEPESASPSP